MMLNLIRSNYLIYQIALLVYGLFKKSKVRFKNQKIFIWRASKLIIVSGQQIGFVREIIDFFEFYFNSVENDDLIVDFSRIKTHKVKGFDDFEICFPSTSEPLETLHQYSNICNFDSDGVLIDLGAYAGMSSIYFARTTNLKVIAVEPDSKNLECLYLNIGKWNKNNKNSIQIYPYAISDNDGTGLFVENGNMASSLIRLDYRGRTLDNKVEVQTRRLSSLEKDLNLQKIDFIKADIEGSELEAFSDTSFFSRHSPKILLEPLNSSEENRIKELLKSYGYNQFKTYSQVGSKQKLMFCEKLI